MGISIFKQARVVFAGFALAGSMTLAQAAPVSFTVPLTGAQQVPAVQTSGTGSAALTYDPSTRVVTWTVTFSGLSSAATMAHFHGPAESGKNAGVELWISQKGAAVTSPVTGQATLTPTEAQQFAAGQMYVNIHTKEHPAGEIRGQVQPPAGN
jgi:CHRD domain